MSASPPASWMVVTLAALCCAGCSKDDRPPGSGGSAKLLGPTPNEQVAMAFDPKDADKRREGIDRLSQNSWGLQEQYLKGYALILKQDSDASVRAAAARALGRSGNGNYLPQVVAALEDRSPAVRLQAAVALDRMTGEQAVEPLRRHALLDGGDDVRMQSAKALRHYRQKPVLEALVRCLSDPSFGVAYTARQSLAELTGRDLGAEPGNWAPLLSGEMPLRAPQRPWWDWMGLTRGGGKAPPASQPASRGAGGGGP